MEGTRLTSIIIFLLITATCAVYGQVSGFDFVHLDDYEYVVRSPIIARGLSTSGIAMAFASPHQSAWIPLTWLSFLLDHAIYGLNAGGYHVTNLLLHLFTTVLLFLFLSKSTRSPWKSGIVAALFAVHPLHVESVAWVASRKDVLSGFFWMLCLVLYLWYYERKTIPRYLSVVAMFAAGLLAKPVVVTLPLVLLLLDYWPLGRFSRARTGGGAGCRTKPEPVGALILEKVPLLVIAAASCLLTLNVWSITDLPLRDRLANAPVAVLSYIGKMLWPVNLSFFYPHPESGMHPAATAAAVAALLLAYVWAYAIRNRYPYIFMGLLWYLITLVPVMGIVQTGMHALADRFTYIPLTGLFIAAVWGIDAAPVTLRHSRAVSLAALGTIACLCVCSWQQARLWQGTRPLCEQALRATQRNYMAHNSLGAALEAEGMPADARRHYEEAIAIKPGFVSAHRNLAVLLIKGREFKQALDHLSTVARLSPGDAEVFFLTGLAQEGIGDIQNARSQYLAAITADPRLYMASNNLGVLHSREGNFSTAIRCFTAAIEERPGYAPAYVNRARAYLQSGDDQSALGDLEMAVTMMPDRMRAAQELSAVLAQYGRKHLSPALYAAAERQSY